MSPISQAQSIGQVCFARTVVAEVQEVVPFVGEFPPLLSPQLQATMEDVKALKEIQLGQGQRMVKGAPLSLRKGQVLHAVEEGAFLPSRRRVLEHRLHFVAQYLLDVNYTCAC